MFKSILCVVVTGTVGTVAIADEDRKNEAFFNHGTLVLEEQGKVTRFITPKALADADRFVLTIKRPQTEVTEPQMPTLSERIEARRIMHDANQAYLKGELARTWELVAAAEQLDPDYYRIKTMKGSLLFKIGSRDLAFAIWQESLEQNPDQPEIVQIMAQLQEQTKIARGTDAGKKDAIR